MSGTTAPAPIATLTPSPLQTFMLRLINESRAAAGTGLRPLVPDAELIAAAQGHAQYMVDADVFSHTGQSGSSPAQRGTAAGFQWTRFGENVAFVSGLDAAALDEADVRRLHTNLMNSAPHRANILSASFTHVGIGIVQGDYRGNPAVFVAQNFATPTAAELADGTGIAEASPSAPALTPEPVPTPVPAVPTPPPSPVSPPDPVRITVAAGRTARVVELRWTGAGYEMTVPVG